MLEVCIASQCEVIKVIVSDYSPCCGVPHLARPPVFARFASSLMKASSSWSCGGRGRWQRTRYRCGPVMVGQLPGAVDDTHQPAAVLVRGATAAAAAAAAPGVLRSAAA